MEFKFERVCFGLKKGQEAYNYVLSQEVPPVLHVYEQVSMKDREDPMTRGPYKAVLIERDDNPLRWAHIVYEIDDPSFDKNKPRKMFTWTLTPSNPQDFRKERFEKESTGKIRFDRCSAFRSHGLPGDSDLENGFYHSCKDHYPEIDKGASSKKPTVHLGSGVVGIWGVRLCSRITRI